MKTSEELRYAALIRARNFCDDHHTELNTITEYAPVRTKLDAVILKIENARAINMADIKTYAAAKAQTQNFLIGLVYPFMLRSAVVAHEGGYLDLEKLLTHPKNYFLRGDDAALGVRADEIISILSTNISKLPNLLPADINKMEAASTAYIDILNAPKEAINNRKAYGTSRLNSLLNEADIHKNNIGKIIISSFAALIPGWDEAIKVGKSSGVRHTSLAIHFLIAGTNTGLKNVKCTLTNGKETIILYSTRRGWVRFYGLTSDKWNATCEIDTYDTIIKSGIDVDDKHLEKIEIKLQKNTLPGILSLSVLDKATSKPLPGVLLSIPALSYTHVMSNNGTASFEDLDPGNYSGTLSCQGYLTLNFDFAIQASKTTSIQLYMEKEP